LTWPPALDLVSPGAVIVGLMAGIIGMVPGIHISGPLGKPLLEDDEREAALRKARELLGCGETLRKPYRCVFVAAGEVPSFSYRSRLEISPAARMWRLVHPWQADRTTGSDYGTAPASCCKYC
jgi:hypothetical protein